MHNKAPGAKNELYITMVTAGNHYGLADPAIISFFSFEFPLDSDFQEEGRGRRKETLGGGGGVEKDRRKKGSEW